MTNDPREIAPAAETSDSLLDRVKSLDPKAWARFVSLYSPLVYYWCCRAGFQEADAADIGQEVFRSVFRSVSGFGRTGPGSFRRWLKTITNNKCRDFVRRRRPGSQGDGGSDAYATLLHVPEDAADESADESVDDATGDEVLLLRQAVQLVLAELSPDAGKAFLRVVGEGHAPADVARDLGMTANAVYIIVSRVKRRIREEFAGLVAD